jgi:two-component system response regulator RegA
LLSHGILVCSRADLRASTGNNGGDMQEPKLAGKNSLAQLKRVLIVEDDETLRRSLARVVRQWGAQVSEAGSIHEGIELLQENPDLLITDVALPDGDAFRLLELASARRPAPVAIAVSGQTSTEDAFRLAQLGCRAFLEKPFQVEELAERVQKALSEAPKIDALVAASVGRTPMRELQTEVRRVMVEQALAKAEGSRSGAARLLSVSRQAVQQMVREREEELGIPTSGDDKP